VIVLDELGARLNVDLQGFKIRVSRFNPPLVPVQTRVHSPDPRVITFGASRRTFSEPRRIVTTQEE